MRLEQVLFIWESSQEAQTLLGFLWQQVKHKRLDEWIKHLVTQVLGAQGTRRAGLR